MQVEATAVLEEKEGQKEANYQQQLLESRKRLDSTKERVQELENQCSS